MSDSLPLTFLDAKPAHDDGALPLVILHGLFGSARNWQGYVKLFGQGRPTYALDLRNHGGSPWSEAMDYPAMAADVRLFLDDHGIGRAVVLGHSMGGKTAMALALTAPERVERLIVVDIAPVAYTHSHSPYVEAMRAADLTGATRRSQVDGQLKDAVPDPNLRAFLLQNLVTEGEGVRWRINLDGIGGSMDALVGFPDFGAARYDGPALFIGGTASDYVTAANEPAIRRSFPKAEIEMVPGAGHWVHAEKPEAFTAMVNRVL